MRIAFDHQAFTLQKTGGISRYFCRVAEELNAASKGMGKDVEVGVFAPFYRNLYLREAAKSIVHGFPVNNYPTKTATLCVYVNQLIARSLIKGWQPDIVHETYFSSNQIAPKGCPVILTVFDMISELAEVDAGANKRHLQSTVKYRSVLRADHIICISKTTKQDLIELFDVPANKVSVVHLGCDQRVISSDLSHQRINQRPFLLYVGLRDGYKNFNRLLRAISLSPQVMREFDLIAFGGPPFSKDEQSFIKELGYAANQVQHRSGGDDFLINLYQNAAAFVYPSTYEGFGLPPIEAMSHQCPVISSNTSSMPEIIGEAGQYFDPLSEESMSEAIEQVVISHSRTKELISMGNERHKLFTWGRCAQETLNIYRSLAPRIQ